MTAILASLLLFAAPFEGFDAPLDPARWYIGTPNKPKAGRLKLAKGAWIAPRELGDFEIRRFEVRFRQAGGQLEIAFFKKGEPLSRPVGEPIVIPKGKGDRVFVISPIGVHVDGEPTEWKGKPSGVFRLRALKGAVDIDEIRIAPLPPAPPQPSRLERDTLFYLSLPPAYSTDGEHVFRRVTLTLWDAEVAFLFCRGGEQGFATPLRGDAKGAPLLGWMVAVSDGRAIAGRAAGDKLAMADWGDERGNLSPAAYQEYLAGAYRELELLMQAQRCMLAALPEKRRKACAPMLSLVMIRHAGNSRAALALAESLGHKDAVKLVRKHLGGAAGRGRPSSDKVRAAAAKAAKELLGAAPAEWPGFTFDPQNRVLTLEQVKEILR